MNRRVVMRRYPDGPPQPGDFAFDECEVQAPAEGEVLVEVTHLSMDPFPRLRMRPDSGLGPSIGPGDLVDSRGIGHVIDSRHVGYKAGDFVSGDTGWQTHATLSGDRLRKVDIALGPPERHLSVLGPSGLTAYFSMCEVGQPAKGETVLIAPAAGSVGALAGQIARLRGARVVGAGRGCAQCEQLAGPLGFDTAVDSDDPAALKEALADGIDIFLDGVGGALHEAALPLLRPRARVVLLGFISGYGEGAPPRYGNAASILFARARMEGFLLADWETRFPEAQRQLARWLAEGAIRAVETIWDGLDAAPEAFCSLFGRAPPGKQIVRLVKESLS